MYVNNFILKLFDYYQVIKVYFTIKTHKNMVGNQINNFLSH